MVKKRQTEQVIFEIRKLLYFIILGSLIYSCTEQEEFIPSPINDPFGLNEQITASIQGRVIDENDEPIQGAEVRVNSSTWIPTRLTDENGYFLFSNAEDQGASAFLIVSSPGKFKGFRRLSRVSGKNNYTEIKMMDKQISGSLDAAAGGTITHYSGAEVTIEEASVISQDGSLYLGDVGVSMAWINPSSEDLPRRLIGDLTGIDENGEARGLISFGMLTVEITDEAGNELNIYDGGASLKFPIPEQMRNRAGNTIPLWYFDETLGRWIEEGTAHREGDNYIGRISHFSSFNIDYKGDIIDVTGQAVWDLNENADSASFLHIYVYNENFGIQGGWLCGDGSFRFYNFPSGESFELKIIGNCNKEVFSGTFGPYSEDTDLGVLLLNDSEAIRKVQGKLVNCDGNPVTHGQIFHYINIHSQVVPFDNEGNFELCFNGCLASFQFLSVIDFDTEKSFTINPFRPGDTTLLKNLVVCEDPDDFVLFRAGEEDPIFLYHRVSFSDYGLVTGTGEFIPVVDIFHTLYNTPDPSGMKMTIYTPMETLTRETTAHAFEYEDSRIKLTHAEGSTISVLIDQYDSSFPGSIGGTFEGEVLLSKVNGEESIVPLSGSFKVPVQ